MEKNKNKIAVLVSGGVDSAVALYLLKKRGYNVTAYYLKIWLEDELSYLGNCPWQEDLKYVELVCEQLNVPLKIISLQKEYHDQVVSYVLEEVSLGRTPNPDILCNQKIKFGAFFKKCGNEFDLVATGHYAQIMRKDSEIFLCMSPDPIKDQTYFLSQLSKDQLSKIIFPIGHLNKQQVRELADDIDLPNKKRKDSQGICFLGKIKFTDFLRHHLPDKTGELIEYESGKVLGKHNGFWYYTIGQRSGIRLAGGPWYVVSKDVNKNIVYISKSYYDVDKKRNIFTVSNMNWITNLPENHDDLKVKLRHGPKMHDCEIEKINDNRYRVILKENDQGIASGQFAVFYINNICLGSGVID